MKSIAHSMKKIILILVVSMLLGYGCEDDPVKVSNTGEDKIILQNGPEAAKEYKVIGTKDFNAAGRKRVQYYIETSTNSMDGRLYTCINAAKELQKKSAADTVYVSIEPSIALADGGYQYCIVRYAPDGQGHGGNDWKWEAECSDQVLTQTQIQVATIWRTERDKFVTNGDLDEANFKKYIAEKLNVPVDEVTLPYVQRHRFSIE